MKIERTSDGEYHMEAEQWLPRPLDEVFAFFSKAANLEAITPPWIQFNIASPDVEMEEGAVVEYRLKVKGVSILWQSEIPVWDPPNKFVDNQIKGPYKKWHHQHLFEAKDGGTLITDRVDYRVPGGALVNRFFVEPDIRKIFAHRQKILAERFG